MMWRGALISGPNTARVPNSDWVFAEGERREVRFEDVEGVWRESSSLVKTQPMDAQSVAALTQRGRGG